MTADDILRQALSALVEQRLADAEFEPIDEHEAALRRLREVAVVRAEAEQLIEALLDEALLRARHASPVGATWAQLGEILGISGQAVGQRLRRRLKSERTERTRPSASEFFVPRRFLAPRPRIEPIGRPDPPPPTKGAPSSMLGTSALPLLSPSEHRLPRRVRRALERQRRKDS